MTDRIVGSTTALATVVASRGAVTDGVIDGDRVVAVAVALPFFGDLFVVHDVEVVDVVVVDVVVFFDCDFVRFLPSRTWFFTMLVVRPTSDAATMERNCMNSSCVCEHSQVSHFVSFPELRSTKRTTCGLSFILMNE